MPQPTSVVNGLSHHFVCSWLGVQVVRRSNALQDHAYGSPFHYSEVSGGKGFSGERAQASTLRVL